MFLSNYCFGTSQKTKLWFYVGEGGSGQWEETRKKQNYELYSEYADNIHMGSSRVAFVMSSIKL